MPLNYSAFNDVSVCLLYIYCTMYVASLSKKLFTHYLSQESPEERDKWSNFFHEFSEMLEVSITVLVLDTEYVEEVFCHCLSIFTRS
jgi:hypothetical protein